MTIFDIYIPFRPFNSLEALQRAKRVVEQQYAVVGVLEDMNSTLTAFERYVPKFFQGALKLYWGKKSMKYCLFIRNKIVQTN